MTIPGRIQPFMMVSRIKRFRALLLRPVLFYIHVRKSTQRTAKSLDFLHFVRWTIIGRKRLLRLHGTQPVESLRHGILLFCTSYDGDWDDYIGTFSHRLSKPLGLVWNRCLNFPGARPDVVLKDYVRAVERKPDFFYCAYSEAAVHDVRAALDLYGELERFAESSRGSDGARYDRLYTELLVKVQDALGSTRPARPAPVSPPGGSGTRKGPSVPAQRDAGSLDATA